MIPDRGELVHGDNRKDEEDEDDKCNDQSNKFLDARLRIVVETVVACLLAKFFGREQFLCDWLVMSSNSSMKGRYYLGKGTVQLPYTCLNHTIEAGPLSSMAQ